MTPNQNHPAECVILFVVDGLRPDGIQQAETPYLDRLLAQGSHSFAAQTVMPSVTLPTHTSLFYSQLPETHGVQKNVWQPQADLGAGLVEWLHQAGRRSAAFFSWGELRDLWRPGAIDFTYFLNIYSQPPRDFDMEMAQAAADYMPRERPSFIFIYLGMTDEIGHRYGWLSPEYLQAVKTADTSIGHVMNALEESGQLDHTAILVQSDHGGHDHKHGEAVPEDMTIPWILWGPGVRPGYQLQGAVSILDSAPTLVQLLGMDVPEHWAGKVVREALL